MFDVSSVMQFGKMVMTKENEQIFEEGTPTTNYAYVVVSGKISLFTDKIVEGKTVKMCEIAGGSSFGECALISKRAYTYTAIATEKSALILLNKDQFISACNTVPLFAFSTIEGVCSQLNSIVYKEYVPEEEKKQAKISTDVKKVEINTNNAQLFPIGVKLYDKNEPETYQSFVYDYETKCPICGETITVKAQHTTRLVMVETDYDLHKHYKDFEPVWYNIWTCPNCYYSNLFYDFEKDFETPIKEQDLIDYLKPIKSQVKLNFSVPKNIDEVITSYYIAIYCAEFYEATNLKKAKLWLQLSWIYKDIQDNEMYMKAARKALDYYSKMYYDSNELLDGVNEQACFVVMAELFILFGDYERALTFLMNAKNHDDGNRYYTLRADRRAQDVREMHHAEMEAKKAAAAPPTNSKKK